MRSELRRRLTARALPITIALCGAAPVMTTAVVKAAGSTTCDYQPAKHRVVITMTGRTEADVSRTPAPAGRIRVLGAWCDGATVRNTDLVAVEGNADDQTF